MQNRAQKVILDARNEEVYKYITENPAESFKTIQAKGIFKDIKGRPISAQRIYGIYKKYEAVHKLPLTTLDMGDYNNVKV